MEKLSPQVPLGLSKDEATFANYFPGKNASLVDILKQASIQPGRQVYIYGAPGYGRSHLLQACNHLAHQHDLASVYVPLSEAAHFNPDMLVGLEACPLICVDDVQCVAANVLWEEALFHLYNRARDASCSMIFSASDVPGALPIRLPDLASRLSWGGVYELHSLTDAEKLTVLAMRAEIRGIHLADEVGKYILTHYSRHMGTLFSALDYLDQASLAAKRKLTIPFVKEVLAL